MSDIWFISDTHFGHKNILNFTKEDGSLLRPFNSTFEMDMYMVEKWNEVVKPNDKVYHLGDVAFTDGGLNRLEFCNGHKRLVKGNHDKFKLKKYLRFFQDIHGVRQIDGFWFTHVPMHTDSIGRAKLNVHGHLHYREVLDKNMKPDPRYFNVSVERLNYRPISFDELKEIYEKRK